MIMDNVYAQRIENIRNLMRDKRLDAVIITGSDPHGSEYPASRWKQVEWVCGFTGEAGDLVITLDHAGLWTDTRYFIQAVEQLEGTGVELHKTRIPGEIRIPQWLAEIAFAERSGMVTVAVDGMAQMVSDIDALNAAFMSAGFSDENLMDSSRIFRVVDLPDMLDCLWKDRPAVPFSPIITLGDGLVGESRQAKISWLRQHLVENDCDAILLTSLDEIAWLLNVRGSDVECNPVVISYLIVTLEDVKWYVWKGLKIDSDVETLATFSEMESEGVEICRYDDISLAFADPEELEIRHLLVDRSTLNYHLYRSILEARNRIEPTYASSPVPLRKAVKNDLEISGMRDAHFEDGIAMEKFLYWLDNAVSSGETVTEWDAAVKLDSLRKENQGFVGNSFQTISAYGPSAALPHYVTKESGSRVLEPHGLYLCDSGGQYMFGTTDLTRTVPLGECTELEKEDYTLVLKGHIGLATAVFPAGTSGCQIDYAARGPLWKNVRDFGHGTGHGVGFFLNVHEGPQEIRHNFNSQALLPGMVTSDEPGIYREGLHGIRHENLLLCVEKCTNDFGTWLCFENLTICHIDTSALVPSLLTDEEIEWVNSYNANVLSSLAPYLSVDEVAWLEAKTAPVCR